MSQTQIRGSSQILDASIPAAKLASSLNLSTSQLAEGALFLKKDGTVSLTASLNFNNFTGTSVSDPVNPQDIVNYRTVQSLVNGVSIKPSARVTTNSNVALSGLQTIDVVTLLANDRVLLTGQSTASQNGLWLAQSGSWTRPTDWAAASSQKEGILVLVAEGTTYHDTKWICITDGIITVDTTPITWQQDSSGTAYSNGNGLSLTGSTFAVKNGNGITFDGSQNLTLLTNGSSLNLSASGLKISDGTPGQIIVAGAGNAAAMTSVTGDISISSSGVTTVNSTSGTGFLKYAAIISNETPSGAINGSNTAFALANAPAVGSLSFYLNGMLLDSGAGNDYTISGINITMLFAPLTGDKLRAYYTK